MENISNKILRLLTAEQLSYGALADKTGIPKSALQRYATGETGKIPLDRVKLIASALKVSPEYLLGWTDDMYGVKTVPPTVTTDTVTFPVIGEVAAGYDEIAIEDWTGETIEIPSSYLAGHTEKEYFVLTVKGDSMYPHYQSGDRVLVLKQNSVDSGSIGVIMYDGECATLKRIEYKKGEDWLRLVPINPEYAPKLIKDSQLTQCLVIGVPKMLIRNI